MNRNVKIILNTDTEGKDTNDDISDRIDVRIDTNDKEEFDVCALAAYVEADSADFKACRARLPKWTFR